MNKSGTLNFYFLAAVACLYFSACAVGEIIGGGRGVFRVLIRVEDHEERKGIVEARVTLADAGGKEVAESSDFNHLAKVFEPVLTNAVGDAIVYYFSGFAFDNNGQTQGVRGILKVTKKGYPDFQCELSKLLGESLKTDDHNVPSVMISLSKVK